MRLFYFFRGNMLITLPPFDNIIIDVYPHY